VAGAKCSLVDLGPLDAGEAHLMAKSFPGAEAELAERCIERAAGNPLFLEQLLNNALGRFRSPGVPVTRGLPRSMPAPRAKSHQQRRTSSSSLIK
jgi:hypothetical protein